MAKLQVLICTYDSGIDSVAKLIPSPMEDVSFLISWQQSNAEKEYIAPANLLREDIEIHTLNTLGLSRNRNNALAHATGDICLISDDDVTLRPDGLREIISTFEQNLDLSLAAFRYHSDNYPKVYPEYSFSLSDEPKFYTTSSIEIAFRRSSIEEKNIRFNEKFGIGAELLCAGEENIFILDALNSGLTCRYYPITIAEHNNPTTGQGKLSQQMLMSKGAYIYYRYRTSYRTRIMRVAAGLLLRNRVNPFYTMRYMLKGANYIKNNVTNIS